YRQYYWSFLIGLIIVAMLSNNWNQNVCLLLATGFCGDLLSCLLFRFTAKWTDRSCLLYMLSNLRFASCLFCWALVLVKRYKKISCLLLLIRISKLPLLGRFKISTF